jgi:tetratricopeptide (TPR) repeat protein
MLRPYLPPPDRIRTLVTSVNAAWRTLGVSVPVGPLSGDESYTMLRARTGSQDAAAIAELAEDLGHLPLALAQAAAFIDSSGMEVRDYLGLLDHHRDDMLLRAGAVDGHDTLGAVWELSLATLDAESPEAVALLETLAYLAPDAVPMQLLRSGHDQADDRDLEISEAVARLRRYSLVERSGPMFRVHRLVQAAARRRLTPQRRVERLAQAAGLLIAAEPGDWTAPAARRRSAGLVPHVVAVLGAAESLGFRSPPLLGVARRCVAFLRHSASYRAARTIMAALLSWTRDWPENAGELHSEYGDLLDAAGEATLAGEQHRLALDLLRREFGPADIRVARATTRLAHLRNCLGEPLAAIEMHEGALPLLRAHGNRSDVAHAVVDLGYARWSYGRLPAAADAFAEARELLADGPGQDAELLADAVGGMGMVRQDQGDVAAAIELHREALAILRGVYGEADHPAPAQAMDKLGFALRLAGDVDGALKVCDEAVRMLTGALGADDPRVAMALTNEGLALLDAGDAQAAAADQSRAVELFTRAYGEDHPHTRLAAERLRDASARGAARRR